MTLGSILEAPGKETAIDTVQKICPLEKLRPILEGLRKAGKKIVWTNGCFDIMHSGHVAYLGEARKLGDVLVVGLNSDKSVSVIKGPDRPIVPQAQRAQVLAALTAVDYVVIFEDPAPIALLEALRPDVYAKGGDYTVDTINRDERSIVEGYGAKIAIIPTAHGTSTTRIVERIRSTHKRQQDGR